MPKTKASAAILPYRFSSGRLEVFLVHPGGPFWAKKDLGAWSLAKGEFEPPEDPLEAARREFAEETGFEISGALTPLTPRKQPSGKTVHAWAVEADYDPAAVRSNTFEMEWPRGSGTLTNVSRDRPRRVVRRRRSTPPAAARPRPVPGRADGADGQLNGVRRWDALFPQPAATRPASIRDTLVAGASPWYHICSAPGR